MNKQIMKCLILVGTVLLQVPRARGQAAAPSQGGEKAATFFQLDRRVGLLMDLQLASEIPLVQQQN